MINLYAIIDTPTLSTLFIFHHLHEHPDCIRQTHTYAQVVTNALNILPKPKSPCAQQQQEHAGSTRTAIARTASRLHASNAIHWSTCAPFVCTHATRLHLAFTLFVLLSTTLCSFRASLENSSLRSCLRRSADAETSFLRSAKAASWSAERHRRSAERCCRRGTKGCARRSSSEATTAWCSESAAWRTKSTARCRSWRTERRGRSAKTTLGRAWGGRAERCGSWSSKS